MTKSILLCDDEVHILRAAEVEFRRAGYDIRCASNGQAAWVEIQTRRPDLLITDCQMPQLDGLELIEKVRACEATRELPIILLTAKGFELNRDELAHRWRVSAVFPKPFSPRGLFRHAEEILNGDPGRRPATMYIAFEPPRVSDFAPVMMDE